MLRFGHHDTFVEYAPDLTELRQRCGVPFDWRQFCELVGLRVHLGKVYGKGKGRFDPRRSTIYLDSKQSPQHLRLTATHEIGHWVYQRRKRLRWESLAKNFGSALPGRAKEERIADGIAANLLVPSSAIEDKIAEQAYSIFSLIKDIRFECEVPWNIAISRTLLETNYAIAIARLMPSANSDSSSFPILESAWHKGDEAGASAIELTLAYCDDRFEHLRFSSLVDSWEKAEEKFSVDLPSPLNLERVSRDCILVAFALPESREYDSFKFDRHCA